jgi:hypothetical protein
MLGQQFGTIGHRPALFWFYFIGKGSHLCKLKSCLKSANHRSATCNPKPRKPVSAFSRVFETKMKNSEHLSCSVSFWICFQRCKNISSETHTYRDYNWRGETYWTSKNPGNLLLFVFQVSYQKRLISVNSKSCLKSANYRSTTLNPKICNPKPSKPVSASGVS